jgi:prepilin-type N-terminal cleavage/methylation domain-containing protein
MTSHARTGLTLIELLIVIAILAIAAAIVYPNVFPPSEAPAAPSEETLLEQARSTAVARAQVLRVDVAANGAWKIVSESAADSVLHSGTLAEAPVAAYAVRVTELGVCLPVASEQREGPAVDAVSCTVRH